MPDSNSYVTGAAFTNDQIELTVQVDDFDSGDSVEISGEATQSGGAFANYYNIIPVPDPDQNNANHKVVKVSTTPIPPNKFVQDEEVTVVLRVSKVWVTVLKTAAQTTGATVDPGKPADNSTTWGPPKVVSTIW